MKRMIFLTLGVVAVGLGTIGIYLPGLPTTGFYLLAAYCFARSSEKFHQKLIQSKAYQTYIQEPFVDGRITRQKKIRIFLSMGLVFAIAIVLVPPVWAKILLAIIYLAHIVGLSWYWAHRKTRDSKPTDTGE